LVAIEQEVAPVKKKRTYKSVGVQRVAAAQLGADFASARCIVGIDVAKKDMFASLSTAAGETRSIVRFEHPAETRLFVELCRHLREAGATVEVAMESTGTYGDAMRAQFLAGGFPVFQVNAKRCHDAAIVLDGVPSSHDRKSAVLIAWLHAQRVSREWRVMTDPERAARAALTRRELCADPFERNRGRLEALLARHWPELPEQLALDSIGLLTLVAKYPSPAEVHAHREEATDLLRQASHGALRSEKRRDVIASAAMTLGQEMTTDEEFLLRELAAQSLELLRALERIDSEIADIVKGDTVMQRLATALGSVSAAAIVAHLGDPSSYESAASFVKAAGLNLKERSSGKHVGQLKITKRGPARVRVYLYFAALRLIRDDRIVKAWHRRRGNHGVKRGMSGVVAVMRKLARALPHIAKGATFDSAKLFDKRRLGLAETAAPSSGASPIAANRMEVTA
jgi:transposase